MRSLMLTEKINEVISELIKSGDIENPSNINTSEHPSLTCEDFANTVISHLPIDIRNRADVIGIDNFIMHDEDGVIEGSEFNVDWITDKWPSMAPPSWFGWKGMNNFSNVACFNAGTHIWIYLDGYHYDSECTQGVLNPLDLPFFKRGILEFAKAFPELIPEKLSQNEGMAL